MPSIPKDEFQLQPFFRSFLKCWGCMLAIISMLAICVAATTLVYRVIANGTVSPAAQLTVLVVISSAILSYVLVRLARS